MNSENIKAFFFDLDGTLMDSEIAWFKALQEALKLYSVELPDAYALEIYGRDWNEVYNRITAMFSEQVPSIKTLKSDTLYCYQQKDSSDMIIKESKDLLVRLSHDFPVAIVSGASNGTIRNCIGIMDISKYVDFYVGYDEYSRPKPNPECYHLAADRAGVLPEECVVFEDSEVGICSAKDAGMFCVALARRQNSFLNHSHADMILSSLDQFEMADVVG
ncbi:MAG: HAD family phosphatase [Kiritimatiellae bacterium]|jgi:beta-phosphoglucomutase|nr:HAD family phosphatase [Kiritimatiellia bacterium]